MDPQKTITAAFMAEAPGCATSVDPRILNGHYQKALEAAKQIEKANLENIDKAFVCEALKHYANSLLNENFWHLAQLEKKKPISNFDPVMANQMYLICTCIDELRALLFIDSEHFESN